MPNDPRPTKAQRQADARAKAAELRKKQEASAKRNRFFAIGGAIVAVLGLIGAVSWVLIDNANKRETYGSVAYGGPDGAVAPSLADVKAPSTADATGGIPISDEGVGVAGDGDTVLSIYFDLQCPACQSFDTVNSADLEALAGEPGITVVYQPLTFLDSTSQGTLYSSRAANALMTVADQAPEQFQDFITVLYANQPAEYTSGLPDSKIAELAASVGVPQAVIDAFTTTTQGTYQVGDSDGNVVERTGSWRIFAPFLAAATTHASEELGGLRTPTILVDGEELDTQAVPWNVPGALAAHVREVAAGA